MLQKKRILYENKMINIENKRQISRRGNQKKKNVIRKKITKKLYIDYRRKKI